MHAEEAAVTTGEDDVDAAEEAAVKSVEADADGTEKEKTAEADVDAAQTMVDVQAAEVDNGGMFSMLCGS